MERLSKLNSTGGAPWLVGVPTREADFVASEPKYQRFARQVDLSRIPVFAAAGKNDLQDSNLGWADAQRAPHAPSSRCPGSGRALFYEGHYLKGVGRTQFAWNWNVRRSIMHGTGHLAATGAVRELLVSDYLEAVGAGHTIVPCVAILTRDMDPEFGDAWRSYTNEENIRLAPVDRVVQAISVKPAGFMRWSNLIHECLQTDIGHGDLIEPLELLYRGLGGQEGDEGITPTAICEAIEAAIARGLDNFQRLYELGVYWHSFNNNFTLDGRFLDLELASVLGQGHPCGIRYCGVGEEAPERIANLGVVPGEELAFFVRQAQASMVEVMRVLAAAGDDWRRGDGLREFLRAVAEGMGRICESAPLTRSEHDEIAERLFAMWSRFGGDEAMLRRTARGISAEYLDDAPAAHLDDGGRECHSYEMARPEPGVEARALYPAGSSGPPTDPVVLQARDSSNDALHELDDATSSEDLMARLTPARARVRAAAAALREQREARTDFHWLRHG